jgi:hypothetical protein
MAFVKDKTEEWDMNRPSFAYSHAEEKPPMRTVLYDFAIEMEAKLRKNDHKTGWRDLPIEALERFMKIEIQEYEAAREFLSSAEAKNELVDIANFAMMLHDRLGMEDAKE